MSRFLPRASRPIITSARKIRSTVSTRAGLSRLKRISRNPRRIFRVSSVQETRPTKSRTFNLRERPLPPGHPIVPSSFMQMARPTLGCAATGVAATGGAEGGGRRIVSYATRAGSHYVHHPDGRGDGGYVSPLAPHKLPGVQHLMGRWLVPGSQVPFATLTPYRVFKRRGALTSGKYTRRRRRHRRLYFIQPLAPRADKNTNIHTHDMYAVRWPRTVSMLVTSLTVYVCAFGGNPWP